MLHLLITITICVSITTKYVRCDCDITYITICDNIEDLADYTQDDWTELMVRSKIRPNSTIDHTIFKHPELLRQIYIVGQANDIRPYSLDSARFKRLYYLNFYDNNFGNIRSNSFNGLDVHKLSLKKNSIHTIDKGAFRNCKMDDLDLSMNNIAELRMKQLVIDNLHNLQLSHNQIKHIEAKSLPPNLQTLQVDHNLLEHLDYNVFDNLNQLEQLILSHNQLEHVVKVTGMASLQLLDLSHNKITTIEDLSFAHFTNLQYLSLAHNQLKALSPNIFGTTTTIQTLNLDHNLLTSLSEPLGIKLLHLKVISLFGNPWNCQCFKQMEEFLERYGVTKNQCEMEIDRSGQVPLCIVFSDQCLGTEEATSLMLQKYHNAIKNVPCAL